MKQSKKKTYKKGSVTPRAKKGLHMTGYNTLEHSKPTMGDMMPFMNEVIQGALDARKEGDPPVHISIKSSDTPKEHPKEPTPTLRDIMSDEVDWGELEYSRQHGYVKPIKLDDMAKENMIAKVEKLTLHEQITYALMRPSKGLRLYNELNLDSRRTTKRLSAMFREARKACIHDSLIDDIVKRAAYYTAEEAVLAVWNARPPSDNMFIEWTEPVKQYSQRKWFSKLWHNVESSMDTSSLFNPKIGYWIRKTETIDGVYLGDTVYSIDGFIYFTNNEYDTTLEPAFAKELNNKVYMHDMSMVVNFAEPFSEDVIDAYRNQSVFQLNNYTDKHKTDSAMRKKIQEILYPFNLPRERAVPSALNVDRILWGNMWSYANSKKDSAKDWDLLRRHVMWKSGLGKQLSDHARASKPKDVNPNSADFTALVSVMGDLRFLIATLDIFNYDRHVTGEIRKSNVTRKLIRGESIPVDEHMVIKVRLPKEEGVNLYKTENNGSQGSGAGKRHHPVDGHWRQYKALFHDDGTVKRNAKRVWIKEHHRGDKNLGVITKSWKLMGGK